LRQIAHLPKKVCSKRPGFSSKSEIGCSFDYLIKQKHASLQK